MLDDMRVDDIELKAAQIRQLENADQVAHFFRATLGYKGLERTNIPDYATLGIDGEDLHQEIHRIELLAADPVDEEIRIYLFAVRSVTAKLRNDIARRFRERPENALLVLTSDYEELDFVLLEREVAKSQSRGQTLRQVIRPIPLHINRRNPDPVKLRVLKRFTFTEEDAGYQWEKLRSAYVLAEWSEEYFNNRALFSDYYLKNRLADSKLTPEWGEDVHPVGREVYRHLVSVRKHYSRQPERVIRAGLYEPLFKLLGFKFDVFKAGESDAAKPDYLLYAQNDETKPIAAVLTYVWNRNLDDVDTSRDSETPNEIPGAQVVSLLEKTLVPWVIVTNGKLWRLYSATASNKATNYYEVDLEEAIAATDQITALKYWWLMFRRQAFEGFLDNVLAESGKYAKELGERLKNRVFVEIFPQFAKGFIGQMRAQGMKESEVDLGLVFSGTMTFLYRLMFILYAESLDLLPVSEERGYGEHSLYRLKRELAEHGGENEDDAPGLLKKHYSAKSIALYEGLKTIFGVIDQGSEDLNMPTYNGGLFSDQTDSGRFLQTYAIPDQYLALGLDRLARDEDNRTKKLVFIDFKSLGVRQLGSIYEGLLEFKLKFAPEKLAVERDGKREVYVPLAQAKKGARGAAPTSAVEKGEVYLENDKRERKATGSYYTPDYIVKYIVQHTVGPVLDRKFEELRPRLHAAQKNYREARALAIKKGEDPEKFWQLHEPTSKMSQLVDDCLNIRVLDPAMGSGHFLVEVVDFASNKLIDFLNGWSENPVWAALEGIRQDILADMERQRVTIDPARLTRVALLKRAVLKRCVYGVDLNLMAVELAKVSLWLDAFTLGAPLSFLDHHLKWGNSLIGARVKEAQAALEGAQTLFSQNKFAGVMLATDLMRQISYLSDNTVAQTRQSAEQFRQASDHLAPYKRVLDVYTSRWFGNAPSKAGRGATIFDPTVEFLRRDDTQNWLADPYNPKNRLPADDYMKAGLVAKTALQAAEDKHFFHWELEFPEVFFAPSTPGSQDVQLRKSGGFDAVFGNPPYGFTDSLPNFTDLYADLFVYFWDLLFKYVRPSGNGAFITPSAWLTSANYLSLRDLMLKEGKVLQIIALPYDVFPDAYIDTCIAIVEHSDSSNEEYEVHVHHMEKREEGENIWDKNLTPINVNLWRRDADRRFLLSSSVLSLGRFYRSNDYYQLAELIRLERGVQPYGRQKHSEAQIEQDFLRLKTPPPQNSRVTYYPELLGDELSRYEIFPEKRRWLEYSDRLAGKRDEAMFNGKRVVLRRLLNRRRQLMSAVTAEKLITTDNVINILVLNQDIQPEFLSALLNSAFLAWLYTNQSAISIKDDFPQVTLSEVSHLPIPRITFTTPADERERLVNDAVAVYDAGDDIALLAGVRAVMAQDQADVVHDLLAHLARQMIDLNKQKQTEVRRFLGWLEDKLKIAPKKDGSGGIDTLTGKTILQNYLGDYQKREPEISWQDFNFRLHQNRNRFGVALSSIEAELQREYEKSLKTLIPVKLQLARTDALIDQIVYWLYRLTDAEIKLIERSQFEQGLAGIKAHVLKDKKVKDDEAAVEKIAERILPPAKRFFERVEPATDKERLDTDLPGWDTLPPEVPTFLLTAEYNIANQPEHLDFSTSVISYSKAVETTLYARVFLPFRDSSGYTANDCDNKFLKEFMQGSRELTLGSFPIILASKKEPALTRFVEKQVADAQTQFYGSGGVLSLLTDQAMIAIRNAAAHDERLGRDAAQKMRTWAFAVLQYLS